LSGRRRKSKNFSLPANPSEPPLRKLTPKQDERASEAFLVSSLIEMLRWEWRSRVDVESGVELFETWAPTFPKATIRALEEGPEDFPDDPDEHDSGAGFSLLLAFTDRLLGLDLPATNLGVFQGPPIVARRGDGLPPGGPALGDGAAA
jgi:hypothetical protein